MDPKTASAHSCTSKETFSAHLEGRAIDAPLYLSRNGVKCECRMRNLFYVDDPNYPICNTCGGTSLTLEMSQQLLEAIQLQDKRVQQLQEAIQLQDKRVQQLQDELINQGKVNGKRSTDIQEAKPEKRQNTAVCVEEDSLIKNYAAFCNVKDVRSFVQHFVPLQILKIEHVGLFYGTEDHKEQVIMLLDHINNHFKGGNSEPYHFLLHVMETHGNKDTWHLAVEIKKSLGLPVKPRGDHDDPLMELCSRWCTLKEKEQLVYGDDYQKVIDEIRQVDSDVKKLLEGIQYRVIHDHIAERDGEISISMGDIISQPSIGDVWGWMVGCVTRTGKKGLFPLNHVEKCSTNLFC